MVTASAVTLLLCLLPLVSGNSMYYCSELDPPPQKQVDIEQIMGMWYGIEIISHNMDAKHEVVYEEGCPILYFSEDRTPTSTPNPLHGDYNYNRNYAGGYGRYDDRNYEPTPQTDQEPYWYTTQNSLYDVHYENSGNHQRRRYNEDIKRMRVLWDDRGNTVEYTVRYNVTKAGFWISSGPQNGSSLDAKFNEFAGTIQVLKAVGNHLVLVFCHQLPDRQLYTVLLSRVQNLSRYEVSGVHNLLNRRGLSTTSVRKVCTSSGFVSSFNLAVLIVLQIAVFLAA